jgi:TRAP transporter TAXI family solute receptor
MNNKRIFAMVVVFVAVVLSSSCALSSEKLGFPSRVRLNFGTASIGGVSYVFGSSLAQVLNTHVENLEISTEVTGGPVPNIGLVSTGQMDLGHVTDSVAYEGFRGIEWAKKSGAFDNIRALFATYPSAYQAFCIDGVAGIQKHADLDGKRIGFGPSGSSGDVVGHAIFGVLGIKPKKEYFLGWSDTIGNMKDGIIEAAVDVGGFPHASRQELEATHKIKFLPLSDEEIEKVQKVYPYYLTGVIPANTYRDQEFDWKTIFIWNEVICSSSLSDDIAYMLTKAAFACQPQVARAHVGGETLLPENVAYITIPLHPGAIRFYEEIGIKLNPCHYPEGYSK